MRSISLLFVLSFLFIAGCQQGPASMAGTYRIEQTGQAIGEGAEKITLTLKDDKTYAVEAGPMKLLSGSWTQDGEKLNLSSGNQVVKTGYQRKDGALIPMDGAKEVSAWRWKKK